MKRKLTEQELNAINIADAKEVIATKKYGTQIDETEKNKLRDRYFTEEIGIKEYSKYQKPSSWRGHTEIIYKDIVRDYSPSIQKILDDMVSPKWTQIAGILSNLISCKNSNEYALLAETIERFGVNDDWPTWITSIQTSMVRALAQQTKYNQAEYLAIYFHLVTSKKLSVSSRSHLANKFSEFGKTFDITKHVNIMLGDSATQLQTLHTVNMLGVDKYRKELKKLLTKSKDELLRREIIKLLNKD